MKSTVSILFLVLFVILFSCENDDLQIQNHSGKISRKLIYWSIEDTIPRVIQNYSYNSKGRLIKIQDNYSTQLFEYNQNEQLIRKYTYRTDENGTVLNDTTYYNYENGKLASAESVNVNDFWHHKFVYEYENEKLIRKKEYSDQHLQELTKYEYSGDLCTKEIYYTDSIESRTYGFRGFLYDNKQLALSTFINSQDWILQVIYYFYDDHGNLILEDAEQKADVSAGLSYCYRYEYY